MDISNPRRGAFGEKIIRSRISPSVDRFDQDQFTSAAAGVFPSERAFPTKALRRSHFDQKPFEVNHVAWADRLELACHLAAGGNHMHIGAMGFDHPPRYREGLRPPAIEAASLGNRDLFQDRAVRHGAPT